MDTSSPSPTSSRKRGATAAGLNSNNNTFRAVKRRASKACQCCRARKVRCNVVEHGAPCTNCRLDEVECIITESKRRKKIWGSKLESKPAATSMSSSTTNGTVNIGINPLATINIDQNSAAAAGMFQRQNSISPENVVNGFLHNSGGMPGFSAAASNGVNFKLPEYIKPIPTKRPIEDLEFLVRKGALSLPEEPLRSKLLKAHFDFVHPYMPLLDKKEFLQALGDSEGRKGKVGLLLFQAVMFTGSAFVDMDVLRAAGFTSRRAARRNFYMKARLLYDFDIEQDRLMLVQAILLMTYWYETPDDQKDTWHWMGVAVSLSHTIGLHRNPEESNMTPRRKKLWKRIWWSCVMRDRLVALGMRRPTRIKDEDCDVPMLTLDDFEIDHDELTGSPLAQDFTVEEKKRYIEQQTQLAVMCIQKAKLCCLISEILHAQYNVLNTNHGSMGLDGSTRTTMLLLPKPMDVNTDSIEKCDENLTKWMIELPESARWRPLLEEEYESKAVVALHRNLLHMVYCTTVSALHRPQVLTTHPANAGHPNAKTLRERSRTKVRQSATQITKLASELLSHDLVRYLPTTGVTAMLPAIIIHLLDIKSTNPATREASIEGFSVCMLIMQGLRQNYASADFACKFLETAIRKSDISIEENRIIRDKILKHRRKSESFSNARRRSSAGQQQHEIPRPDLFSSRQYNPNARVVLTPPPDLPGQQQTVTPMATMNDGSSATTGMHQHPPQQQFPSDFMLDYRNHPDSLRLNAFLSSSLSAPALTNPANGASNTSTSPTDKEFMSAPYVAIPHSSTHSPILTGTLHNNNSSNPSHLATGNPADDLLSDESFLLMSKDFDPFFGHWDLDADLKSTSSSTITNLGTVINGGGAGDEGTSPVATTGAGSGTSMDFLSPTGTNAAVAGAAGGIGLESFGSIQQQQQQQHDHHLTPPHSENGSHTAHISAANSTEPTPTTSTSSAAISAAAAVSNSGIPQSHWPHQHFASPHENWLDISVQERLNLRLREGRLTDPDAGGVAGALVDGLVAEGLREEVKSEGRYLGEMRMEDLVFVDGEEGEREEHEREEGEGGKEKEGEGNVRMEEGQGERVEERREEGVREGESGVGEEAKGAVMENTEVNAGTEGVEAVAISV